MKEYRCPHCGSLAKISNRTREVNGYCETCTSTGPCVQTLNFSKADKKEEKAALEAF